MLKSIDFAEIPKIPIFIIIFHGSLFLTLLILALFIFQSDLYSLWFAGVDCRYCNDSWRFIENSLNPTHPPYPYHPIATSLHYLVLYNIFSVILPSSVALVLSVFIIQFSASLITLYLLYNLFFEIFHLDRRQGLVLVFIYDFVLISPYLLLATSEILFLFYQMLAWTCLVRRHYFFAAISAAITFALRFNGAFFVVGLVLVLFLRWYEVKDISPRLLINVGLTGIMMFIIGFSGFLLSWLFNNDFWLPLTTQSVKYQATQGYVTNGAFSLPFFWWVTYFQYVILSNIPIESIYLIMAVITLGLGFFSLYLLLNWRKRQKSEHSTSLLLFFICGLLGVNIIVAGSNFARFLSYTFPIFPVIPLFSREYHLSFFLLLILTIGAGIWGIFFNIIWWTAYHI